MSAPPPRPNRPSGAAQTGRGCGASSSASSSRGEADPDGLLMYEEAKRLDKIAKAWIDGWQELCKRIRKWAGESGLPFPFLCFLHVWFASRSVPEGDGSRHR